MSPQAFKTFFEVYGLIRMSFGASLLVGFSAGYFLNEFIIEQPSATALYVFDGEMLALISLAVIFRGLFHIVAGIGIARLRDWARMVLFLGWPVMAIITFGLTTSIAQQWAADGFVGSSKEAFSWGKIFLYAVFILFETVIINLTIRKEAGTFREAELPGLKKVFSILSIAIFAFSVLMFLGRPIKQGFHQGFYKSKGEPAGPAKEVTATKTMAVAKTGGDVRKISGAGGTSAEPEKINITTKASASGVTEAASAKPGDDKGVKDARPAKTEKGLAYRKFIGIFGGACLIAAFLFQIFELVRTESGENVSLSAYVLLCLGFLLMLIYAVSYQLTILTATSLACFLLCLAVAGLKIKFER